MAYVYAGRYGPEFFLDAAGDLLPGASIIVYLRGTTTLASLYTDRTKATPAANPFVVGSLGNGTFFADPGEYDLVYGAVTVAVTVPVDPQDAVEQGGGTVSSVNGHTGVVVLAATDVGAYGPGGTDVAVVDGGTGASTAAAARTNLGLGTAATQPTSAFEPSGAVATEAAARATADALLIPKSLVTTKGDVIAATAAGTPARVGVGADGQVLTADAASAAGVKWSSSATSVTPAAAIPAGGIGLVGRGFKVPAGSLDTWRAARAAAGSALCEVVAFGDSLTRGEGPTAGRYSYLQRLRERSVAAGFADGGRGYNSAIFGETLDNYTGEVAPISARSGFAVSPVYGIGVQSNAGGDTVTFKVKASRARLYWSRYTQAGRFSYTVNGGAAVTVLAGYIDAPPRGAGSGYTSENPEVILLGAGGGMLGAGATNTIVVTNLGGNPTQPAVLTTSGSAGQGSGTGNVPAGTYDYVVTRVSGGGETLQSNAITLTIGAGGQRVDLYTLVPTSAPYGGTYNIYRRATGVGLYNFCQQIVNANGNSNFIGSDNTAAPNTGVHPPGVSTAGLDPSNQNVVVNIEAINDTGIVWHNNGASGQQISSLFDTDDLFFNNNIALMFLGLQWGLGTNGIAVATSRDVLRSAAASGVTAPLDPAVARKPKLVILDYGTNDARIDWNTTTPPAPTGATAGVGTLPAATYYYKVKRHLPQFGASLSIASLASAGVTANGSQQIAVTAPGSAENGPGYPGIYSIYRSTSSGGTYQLVGQAVGFGAIFIDNLTTPGPNMPADPATTSVRGHLALVDQIVYDYGTAIQMIRNAGADVLITLPAMGLLAQSGANRGINHLVKAAIQRAAEMYSVPWVDWDEAEGPAADRASKGYATGDTNPHTLKPGYIAKGDFLWDNVLSL